MDNHFDSTEPHPSQQDHRQEIGRDNGQARGQNHPAHQDTQDRGEDRQQQHNRPFPQSRPQPPCPQQTGTGAAPAAVAKNPQQWATGGAPMTAAQRSYLQSLAERTGDPVPETLTKAQASQLIEQLKAKAFRPSQGNRTPQAPQAPQAPQRQMRQTNQMADMSPTTPGRQGTQTRSTQAGYHRQAAPQRDDSSTPY